MLGKKRHTFIEQESFPSIDKEVGYTGHYKVCPKMILSCEFSSRGCQAKFKREDAAAHHLKNAQYHAALIDQTCARLYEWFGWNPIEIIWPIERRKVARRENKVRESSIVTGVCPYDLFLKLYLGRFYELRSLPYNR